MGLRCNNAEVAVIDSDGEFVALVDPTDQCVSCDTEYDDVKGYQSVSEVIAIINKFNDM
tara:strand:- start:1251 stop:1427 length:177 start_codon:yes stop_codon:yes gene_type:complete